MDNMEVTYKSPGEDEPALAVLSLKSPSIAWMFPRRELHYDRYLTFEGVPNQDVDRWKKAVIYYVKRLTLRSHRPLLMKSPAHTSRIKLLLELFPNAKFIHIHRNPFTVYQSTLRLYEKAVPESYIQNPIPGSVEEGIIRRYKDMYSAFFQQRDMIPSGNYHEVCYEQFEQNIVGTLEQIYTSLDLPGYESVEQRYRERTASLKQYQKNIHPELSPEIKANLVDSWKSSFDEWDYETT
jgi:hypothetical protein